MIRIFDTSWKTKPAHDDGDPAAEWLGGEAWVSPAALAFLIPAAVNHACVEAAAADWIPV